MSQTFYRFGPFVVDPQGYRALCDGKPLALTSQQLDLLLFLLERADELVTKETLLDALWPDANVTENALTRAVSELRRTLGDDSRDPHYIRTIARRGYRFIAAVVSERGQPQGGRGIEQGRTDHVDDLVAIEESAITEARSELTGDIGVGISAQAAWEVVRFSVRDTPSLDAARAWTEAWLKLETLDVNELDGAIKSFSEAIAVDPTYAPAYAGLASAEGALYESTRCAREPNEAALVRAIGHARQAIELDEGLAEAHATLGMLLVSAWQTPEAVASARRGVTLEPWQWRHQFRLCHAAWGEARLDAASRTLALYPAFAFAHFQMAMVHVARGHFAQAQTVLLHGVSVQDQQIERRQRFPALGLHWLRGLVLLAEDDPDQAILEFVREEGFCALGQLYGREYAMSALLGRAHALLRLRRMDESLISCQGALRLYPEWIPGHLIRAQAYQALGENEAAEQALARAEHAVRQLEAGRPIEGAIAKAQLLATRQRGNEAAAVLNRLLKSAPPGFAGWLLPIDPLFEPLRAAPDFGHVLRQLADRAR